MNKDIDIKKILLILLALVVLFVPTYIAIASYNRNKDKGKKPDTISTLTVLDPDGHSYTADKKDDTDGMYALFEALPDKATEIANLPESLSGSKFLLAVFTDKTGEESESKSYKYYFSTNNEECYCTDPAGKNYKLTTSAAKSFLVSPYSIYLYSEAQPPVLTVSGNEIPASTLTWYYLTAGSKYTPYTSESSDSRTLSYDAANLMSMNFSNEPSVCTLKVYDGTTLLYDDVYNKLPALNLKKSTTLSFLLSAEWYRSEGCEAYGTSTYSFSVTFDAPAEFIVNKTEINLGDFIVITGRNIADTSKITVSSEPALTKDPVFYREGDYVFSIVPISSGSVKGDYKFHVTYGISDTEFTVKVNDYLYGYKTGKLAVTKSQITSIYTEGNLQNYNMLVNQICSSSEQIRYFSGKFYQQFSTTKFAIGFGRNVQLTNNTAISFEHTGFDVNVNNGTDIKAMAPGKICYVGSDQILGSFVVIDHGYGVKTWYAHLSSPSVNTGDIVTQEQVIGKSGKTGFCVDKTCHLGITIDGIPCAPYALWDEGITFGTFQN